MRLLLDAHVSGRAIGRALRRRGHEVRAANEEPELSRLPDKLLLQLAVAERRILVTFDAKDFVPLLREWAGGGRSHAGCVLVVGLRHDDFGPVVRRVHSLFAERPDAEDWIDRVVYLGREEAS